MPSVFSSLERWLAGEAIRDPVDRRNAPFLQLLFVVVGVIAFANTALYALAMSNGLQSISMGAMYAIGGMLLVGTVAIISLVIVRQGNLRLGVILFITAMLISLAAAYLRMGVSNLNNDPLPLLPLGISGLVLGRRALWSVFFALVVICIGSAVAQWMSGSADTTHSSALNLAAFALLTIGAYLLITLVLDRTVSALRESLAAANERGREAELANEQLRCEMAERERVQGLLLHAQKMEVVGRLASGVAHDFDNVIAVIAGYARQREQLADRGVGALLKAMYGIDMASRRAHAISRKLLNFSRRSNIHPECFDVNEALRELLPMVRQLFPAAVRVQLECQDDPLAVRMDRDQLELLILNIASNACDALAGTGEFVMQCRADVSETWVEIRLCDSGPGIAQDVLPHIFEPFYTTKPLGEGTGLGLSVIRDVINAAGGDISVETSRGKGACFIVRLPVWAKPAHVEPVSTGDGKENLVDQTGA